MWLHVNVLSVERKPCPIDETSWGTETSGCATMSYMTLDERILPHHERRSSSFEYINGIARPTVTHWPKGRLNDWMVSIQFVSVDPVYGLARTCDRSGYIRVFQNSTGETPEFLERTLQIQGQCFMSTVKVQASNTVCPWCVDDSQTTTTTTVTPAPPSTTFSPFFGTSNNTSLLIGMLILAFFSLLALTSTTVLLCVYISDRKKPEFFDMPLPQANSTVLGGRSSDTGLFTTKSSSERWTEYGCEPWSSFQPFNIDSTYNPPRETTCVYKVTHREDDESSDSGNASL
ncbi:C2 domain-containing protein [Caenorhabditis elegans]|uniref:CUB domain-containing protein n=1 Tax=Caenorhabditis elegans TaxID=6239 RepID=Q18604_CAEEL|nr:CUB domain-containing protein [Caenorhabditis elegans]CAA97780.1 CUB domain-containing protein [Caenorhabditis elegans]|eukprot:NP_499396.1 Uncharacterized protein CELE_C44B9.3 [Caenorhabditis elegans]